MTVKEPKFMQELHKIRVQIANEWRKMSPREIAESLHESSVWLKSQMRSRTKRDKFSKHA